MTVSIKGNRCARMGATPKRSGILRVSTPDRLRGRQFLRGTTRIGAFRAGAADGADCGPPGASAMGHSWHRTDGARVVNEFVTCNRAAWPSMTMPILPAAPPRCSRRPAGPRPCMGRAVGFHAVSGQFRHGHGDRHHLERTFFTGHSAVAEALFAVQSRCLSMALRRNAARIFRYRAAIWSDLTNPRLVFSFFTIVAASDVFGVGLHLRGFLGVAFALWLFALVSWICAHLFQLRRLDRFSTPPRRQRRPRRLAHRHRRHRIAWSSSAPIAPPQSAISAPASSC